MWGRPESLKAAAAGVVVAVAGLLPTSVWADAGEPSPGGTATTVAARTQRNDAPTIVELTDDRGRRTELGAGRGASEILTPEIPVSEFHVAGVTWSGGTALPEGARIHLRVREDGQWTDWIEAGVEVSPSGDTDLVNGTEPFITGGATAAQLRVSGGRGALPPDLELALIPAAARADSEVRITELTPDPAVPSGEEQAPEQPNDGEAQAGGSGAVPSGAGMAATSTPLGMRSMLSDQRAGALGLPPPGGDPRRRHRDASGMGC